MATLTRNLEPDRVEIAPAAVETSDGALEIIVLHTATPDTLLALKAAAGLARGLAASIRLLVLEVVPYPLPLDSPSRPLDFTGRRFSTLAEDARIDTVVDIRLGRDREQMLDAMLRPHSMLVLGSRRGWWPTRETRLARRLQRQGHHVMFARTK
jgi:hypothetical protein